VAQEELEAALRAMHQEEQSYKNKCEELKGKSEDPNLGVVQKNKAKNELAQLLAQDPLPLRQAKINTEAAERKADKVRAPFKAAREIAETARAEASRSAKEAERAREEAEHAAHAAQKAREEADHAAREAEESRLEADKRVDEMYNKLAEAEAYMQEVTRRNQVAHGQVWWLERELSEAKKFMPKRRV